MSAATLIFRPRNLILYIEEYVEGEHIEKIEWPISEKTFSSKIEDRKDDLSLKEIEFAKYLKET